MHEVYIELLNIIEILISRQNGTCKCYTDTCLECGKTTICLHPCSHKNMQILLYLRSDVHKANKEEQMFTSFRKLEKQVLCWDLGAATY